MINYLPLIEEKDLSRDEKLNLIYANCPSDYRGIAGDVWDAKDQGKRTMLVNHKGATALSLLENLSDDDIASRIEYAIKLANKPIVGQNQFLALSVLVDRGPKPLLFQLYDDDEEVGTAVGRLIENFEFPNYSGWSLGSIISRAIDKDTFEIEREVSCKNSYKYLDEAVNLKIDARVLALSDFHVAFSIGRDALIVPKTLLSVIPDKGKVVELDYKKSTNKAVLTFVELKKNKEVSR